MADYNLNAEFARLKSQIAEVNEYLKGTFSASANYANGFSKAVGTLEGEYEKLTKSIEEVNKAISQADGKSGGMKNYVSVVDSLTKGFQTLVKEVDALSSALSKIGSRGGGKGKGGIIPEDEVNTVRALKKELKSLEAAYQKSTGTKQAAVAVSQLKARIDMLEKVKKKTFEINAINTQMRGDKDAVEDLKRQEQARTTINKRAKELIAIEQSYNVSGERLAGIKKLEEQYGTSITSIKAKIDALNEMKVGMTDEGQIKKTTADIAKLEQQLSKMQGAKGKAPKVEVDVNTALKNLDVLEKKSGRTMETIKQRIALLEKQKLKLNVDKNVKGIEAITSEVNTLRAKLRDLEGKPKPVGMRKFAESLRLVAVQIASIWTITRALSKVFGTIVDFQYTMTGVAAVTGAAASEMNALKDMAIELGGATIFTAKQFGELELSLGKLGFSTGEIINATKAVSDLTAAFGGELSNNASIAGSTLRAFRMEAGNMSVVTDTMTSAFSNSALDVEKFRESMKFAAPVAEKLGFSVQQTTAMLAKLADAGLYGSLAGTSLRNIMLKMADSGSELNKTMGFQVKTFDDLIGAMKAMNKAGFDLGDALDITDQRAVTAISTLMGGADAVGEFATQLENAGGAADRMASKRMETLKGSINKVQSAWQGMVLDFANADGGVFQVIGKSMNILAKNMKTVASAVVYFGVAWAMLTKNRISSFFAGGVTQVKNFTKAVKTGTMSLKAMKLTATATKVALLGIAAGAAIAFAVYKKLTARTKAVKEAREGLIDSYTDEAEQVANYAKKIRDLQGTDKETVKQREELYRLIEDKYPGILKNLDHEEGKLISQLDLLKEINKAYAEKVSLASGKAEISQEIDEFSTANDKYVKAQREFYNKVREMWADDKNGIRAMMSAEGLTLNFEDVTSNWIKFSNFFSGFSKGLYGEMNRLNMDMKAEMKDVVLDLVKESESVFDSADTEPYADYFKEIGNLIQSAGGSSLDLYSTSIKELQRQQKEFADDDAMVAKIQEQINIIQGLIDALDDAGEAIETFSINVDTEGLEALFGDINLEKYDIQKKREKGAGFLQGTGLWDDVIEGFKKGEEAAGRYVTDYDIEEFMMDFLRPGAGGEAHYRKEALKVWEAEYKRLIDERDKIIQEEGDDSARLPQFEKAIDSLIYRKEELLDYWKAVFDVKGSGKKGKDDLKKVLKAIYEERKAWIKKTYVDSKAQKLLLLKLETEYNHKLYELDIEKSSERYLAQVANMQEFVNKSGDILADYIKENKELYRELQEEDPFNLDTGDKAIAANKKRFADMRRQWDGQKDGIKGAKETLDTYVNRVKDMQTTMVAKGTSITGDLEQQVLSDAERADIEGVIEKLQKKYHVNVDSDYIDAIREGTISFAELDKMIQDVNSQLKKLGVEADLLEKKINFKLVWEQTRKEAKMAYDEQMAYLNNVTENRKRLMDDERGGISSYWAEMMKLTKEQQSFVKEQEELSVQLAQAQKDGFLTNEEIEAKKKELEQLGYAIDEVQRKIYDEGKNKTFLDYIQWDSDKVATDDMGFPMLDGDGELIYEKASLTDDQQQAIRESVAFMKDMAVQMADAWKEAIDSVVAKYDELISASDSRIGELQNDLDREKDLLIAGYANNYDAVKSELKLERDKRKELRIQREKALKEQARAQKVQEGIELATQAANIFTTVTQIIKEYTKIGGPAGIAIGLGVAGAFLGGLAIMKANINRKYRVPTARQGTTGVLQGKSHESGGETIPVEAESGERYSIFSRAATKKYGNRLADITNSANDLTLDSMLYGDVTPAIKENNSQFVNFINNVPAEKRDENNRKVVSLLTQIRDKKDRWVIGGYLYEDFNGQITKRKVNEG